MMLTKTTGLCQALTMQRPPLAGQRRFVAPTARINENT